jgi:hypothetical protein
MRWLINKFHSSHKRKCAGISVLTVSEFKLQFSQGYTSWLKIVSFFSSAGNYANVLC